MTCKIMTDNGAILDHHAMNKLCAILAALQSVADDQRHFLSAVASMHPFEGDPLGPQAAALRALLEAVQAQARELQYLVPAPYVPPPPAQHGCWRRKRREAAAAARQSETPVDYDWRTGRYAEEAE